MVPKLSYAEMNDSEKKHFWHKDWPDKEGSIDLSVHDLPHASSDLEWWYVNSHLKSPDKGREMSLFACFFRSVIGYDTERDELIYAHASTWAISDVETKKYYYYSELDPIMKQYVYDNIDKEHGLDKYLRQSLKEVFGRASLPLPDMEIEGDIVVSQERLLLDYGGNVFSKDEDGCYYLHLKGHRPNDEAESGCSLKIKPLKAASRNRSDGVVKAGGFGDDMFYYFITRNECTGTVTVAGEEFEVVGTAWYDHEFGGTIRAKSPDYKGALMSDNYAWEWLSVQFDDGLDLTACNIENPNQDYSRLDSYSVMVAADGTRIETDNTVFEAIPGFVWRSSQTFIEYPTAWTFKQDGINLKISAEGNPQQEILTLLSFPAFWEGRVQVSGTIHGRQVRGLGFLERHGYDRENMKDLKYLFQASASEMRKEIQKVMPLKGDESGNDIGDEALVDMFSETGAKAVGSFPNDHGREATISNIIEPLRDMYDRGGKAWRSQAILVCIDAVGGNSSDYRFLLPVPEFLHAGSLIIDDIQDKSLTRRGKPCCHTLWGEALAINAGNFSYFVGPVFYKRLPDDIRLQLLDKFFSTMLTAHVGQGADIAGLAEIMPRVVASGNSELATEYITAIHRLKSGVPVRNMAESGCIIGGGSAHQIEAVGSFFEELGIAFQIIDDVVNLMGFDDESWKTCGEDLMEGKVTFPVALAFQYLERPVREEMWAILESKPQEKDLVKKIIDYVRSTGALEESRQIAMDKVESAWQKVAAALPDSFSKVIMRGSALYVLDNLKGSKPLPKSYF